MPKISMNDDLQRLLTVKDVLKEKEPKVIFSYMDVVLGVHMEAASILAIYK